MGPQEVPVSGRAQWKILAALEQECLDRRRDSRREERNVDHSEATAVDRPGWGNLSKP